VIFLFQCDFVVLSCRCLRGGLSVATMLWRGSGSV